MACSLWVAVVTDNFNHTHTEEALQHLWRDKVFVEGRQSLMIVIYMGVNRCKMHEYSSIAKTLHTIVNINQVNTLTLGKWFKVLWLRSNTLHSHANHILTSGLYILWLMYLQMVTPTWRGKKCTEFHINIVYLHNLLQVICLKPALHFTYALKWLERRAAEVSIKHIVAQTHHVPNCRRSDKDHHRSCNVYFTSLLEGLSQVLCSQPERDQGKSLPDGPYGRSKWCNWQKMS